MRWCLFCEDLKPGTRGRVEIYVCPRCSRFNYPVNAPYVPASETGEMLLKLWEQPKFQPLWGALWG